MKTFVIVVETAIISFFAGGIMVLMAQEQKEKQEAAEREAKENPES